MSTDANELCNAVYCTIDHIALHTQLNVMTRQQASALFNLRA